LFTEISTNIFRSSESGNVPAEITSKLSPEIEAEQSFSSGEAFLQETCLIPEMVATYTAFFPSEMITSATIFALHFSKLRKISCLFIKLACFLFFFAEKRLKNFEIRSLIMLSYKDF
jgi:hypothetical protein